MIPQSVNSMYTITCHILSKLLIKENETFLQLCSLEVEFGIMKLYTPSQIINYFKNLNKKINHLINILIYNSGK